MQTSTSQGIKAYSWVSYNDDEEPVIFGTIGESTACPTYPTSTATINFSPPSWQRWIASRSFWVPVAASVAVACVLGIFQMVWNVGRWVERIQLETEQRRQDIVKLNDVLAIARTEQKHVENELVSLKVGMTTLQSEKLLQLEQIKLLQTQGLQDRAVISDLRSKLGKADEENDVLKAQLVATALEKQRIAEQHARQLDGSREAPEQSRERTGMPSRKETERLQGELKRLNTAMSQQRVVVRDLEKALRQEQVSAERIRNEQARQHTVEVSRLRMEISKLQRQLTEHIGRPTVVVTERPVFLVYCERRGAFVPATYSETCRE